MDKIKVEELESLINCVTYKVDHTLTICILELNCGFKVVGHCVCLNPEDFNKEIGKNISYDNAFAKLWGFEGYFRKRTNELREV
jgi:hypothetical protein